MRRVQLRDVAVETRSSCRAGLYRRQQKGPVSASSCSSAPTIFCAPPRAYPSSRSLPSRCFVRRPLSSGRFHSACLREVGRSRRQAAVAAIRSCDRATPQIGAAATRCRGSGRASGVRGSLSSPFNLLSRARCPYRPRLSKRRASSFRPRLRISIVRTFAPEMREGAGETLTCGGSASVAPKSA